ncbi:MAG: DNA cytosine methyltransferase, partial [Kiritimatiellaeota bacterium]|nr:DNA cytosine methyltransferase [Kiritimatiellota bacterium]
MFFGIRKQGKKVRRYGSITLSAAPRGRRRCSPRPIHWRYPRCITNREAARLHSFPDWFRL